MNTRLMNIVLFLLTKDVFCKSNEEGRIIVDLNSILEEFGSSCQISIQNIEKRVGILILNYPILYTFIPKSLNYDVASDYYFNKFLFCRVNIILVTNYNSFTNGLVKRKSEDVLRSQTMQYCSSIHSHLSEYPWTNCVILILGIGEEIESSFATNYPKDFNSKELWSFEKEFGITQSQFYVMFLPKPISEMKQKKFFEATDSNEIIYICRLCVDVSDTFQQVSLEADQPIRKAMEKTAKYLTGNGRNILLPITSHFDNDNNEEQGEQPQTFAFGPMASATKHEPLLKEITMSNYYFRYRWKLNYIQLLQKILFENVPHNITIKTVKFSNIVHVTSFAPESVTLDKYLYRPYGKKLYLDRKDYFNFVTCHGLRKSESFKVYLSPFESQIWYGIISILITCAILFMVKMRKLKFWPVFYHISILLENTGDHTRQLKFSNLQDTGKILFFCVAFLLMVMGNLYKGIITRDIILPIPNTIPFSKIDELKGFELIVLPRKFESGLNTSISYKLFGELKEHKIGNDSHGHDLHNLYSNFGEEIGTLFLFPNVDSAMHDYYEDIYARTKILPTLNYAYELLIQQCNTKKQAFIGFRYELDSFMEYKDSRSEFVYGKDEYIPVNYYWHIPNAVGGYLHERMSMIITSGIEKIWRQIYFHNSKKFKENLKTSQCKDCTLLDTNLGTLFRLCLICAFIGLLVFIIEIIVYHLFKWIRKQ